MDMQRRVARLERTVLALVLALAGVVTLGAVQANRGVFRAEKVVTSALEIVGEDEAVLATFDAKAGGEPRIGMKGKTGKVQAVFGIIGGGGDLILADPDGKAGVRMHAGPDVLGAAKLKNYRPGPADATIAVSDGNGADRVRIRARAGLAHPVEEFDGEGKPIIRGD